MSIASANQVETNEIDPPTGTLTVSGNVEMHSNTLSTNVIDVGTLNVFSKVETPLIQG